MPDAQLTVSAGARIGNDVAVWAVGKDDTTPDAELVVGIAADGPGLTVQRDLVGIAGAAAVLTRISVGRDLMRGYGALDMGRGREEIGVTESFYGGAFSQPARASAVY